MRVNFILGDRFAEMILAIKKHVLELNLSHGSRPSDDGDRHAYRRPWTCIELLLISLKSTFSSILLF